MVQATQGIDVASLAAGPLRGVPHALYQHGPASGQLRRGVAWELTPLPVQVAGFSIAQPFALMLLASALVRLLANVLLLSSFQEFRLRRPAFAGA